MGCTVRLINMHDACISGARGADRLLLGPRDRCDSSTYNRAMSFQPYTAVNKTKTQCARAGGGVTKHAKIRKNDAVTIHQNWMNLLRSGALVIYTAEWLIPQTKSPRTRNKLLERSIKIGLIRTCANEVPIGYKQGIPLDVLPPTTVNRGHIPD